MGPADFDRQQRLAINYSWDLPHPGPGHSWVNDVLNGWQLSGVTTVQTGHPLTLTDSRGGSVYGFASTSRAQFCPGVTSSNIATAGSTVDRLNAYFNASAFCAPPVVGSDGAATGYGNTARGIARGPGQVNFDVALTKLAKVGGIHKNATLEFRSEFFNVFNTPQFADPGTIVGTPSFGVISGTAVNPRLIQLALKYLF